MKTSGSAIVLRKKSGLKRVNQGLRRISLFQFSGCSQSSGRRGNVSGLVVAWLKANVGGRGFRVGGRKIFGTDDALFIPDDADELCLFNKTRLGRRPPRVIAPSVITNICKNQPRCPAGSRWTTSDREAPPSLTLREADLLSGAWRPQPRVHLRP